ncbi:MAG: hypothetical protein EXR72_03860 [Myxococcales bacterium]|nr:hypothetical protein [Myxococcales bacterium]
MRTLLIPIALCLFGCETPPQILSRKLAITGPYEIGGAVMWVDGTRGLVFALDPAASPPTVSSTRIRRNALWAGPAPAGDSLRILTPGKEALKKGELTEAPALTVVRPGPAVARVYPLPSAFDRLAVAADGSAIAYPGESPQSTDAYFRNPNQLALIDLTAEPGEGNPLPRTIRALGSAPLGVVFSPPLEIPRGAPPRTLALVLSKNYLTFLDLSHRERPEITVPLGAQGGGSSVTPRQVVFAASPPTAFVRADGAADVFALALDARPSQGPELNDYLPRVNQPSSGKVARDMILLTEGTRTLLLTVNDSQDLALIDAATSESAIIPIGAPIDSILPVPPEAPSRLVLFSRTARQSTVHFLDLKDLSTQLGQNLTRRTLARPVHDLVPVPGGGQLLVVHDDARTVVSILDLGPHRTDAPIEGRLPLESFDFAGGFLVGVSSGLRRLGVLDLATLSPRDVRLDDSPSRVIALGTRIVVDHGAPQGMVTVLPDPTARREETHVLWGFLLGNLLDQDLRD